MALLHRPLFPGTRPEETARRYGPRDVDIDHESIWISYCPMPRDGTEYDSWPVQFASSPRGSGASWARLKIGAGTPPVLTPARVAVIYHGVSELAGEGDGRHHLCYSAGVMVLSREHPRRIRFRSAEPVLTRMLPLERGGTVANVVFPTGIDCRHDLGAPDRFDVYYGMAKPRTVLGGGLITEFPTVGGSWCAAGGKGIAGWARRSPRGLIVHRPVISSNLQSDNPENRSSPP